MYFILFVNALDLYCVETYDSKGNLKSSRSLVRKEFYSFVNIVLDYSLTIDCCVAVNMKHKVLISDCNNMEIL